MMRVLTNIISNSVKYTNPGGKVDIRVDEVPCDDPGRLVCDLIIEDNGIGMTAEELENNLGTIANSGSFKFKNENKLEEDNQIIGQFGVGFYSAFMVAKKVTVISKAYGSDKAYQWESEGADGYTITEAEKKNPGTEIILELIDDTEDATYGEFLDQYRIKGLIKKYSDYIRFPVKMEVTHSRPKEQTEEEKAENKAPEYEEFIEVETLNSMVPLWKKNKSELKEEDYKHFYTEKFFDYNEPIKYAHVKNEGVPSYNALLYVPSKAPYDFYTKEYEKGLQLYSKGVFIMDKCKELIPDYLRFVKGIVDSSDLSLNISRELLQKSKELKDIAENVEKKIVSKLENLLKNDFDTYLKFFEAFGINLKFGVYDDFGAKKDLLKDLIIYNTINQDKMITLKEYVKNMKEDQKVIYYASAKSKDQVLAMPQMDLIKKHGYDVLILPDDVDEFLIQILNEYDSKKFQSVNQGNLDLLDKEEEKKIEELNNQKKPMLDALKEALKDEVKDVVISKRLTDSAVCLVSEDGVSFEMEKVLSQMPNANKDVKATKILELNPNHELFNAIENIYLNNPNELTNYASLLYNQALLVEGFKIKDPIDFSKKMCELIIKSSK